MSKGRPKGSKSKMKNGYRKRTKEVRRKHGVNCFKRWGKQGGNPALLK